MGECTSQLTFSFHLPTHWTVWPMCAEYILHFKSLGSGYSFIDLSGSIELCSCLLFWQKRGYLVHPDKSKPWSEFKIFGGPQADASTSIYPHQEADPAMDWCFWLTFVWLDSCWRSFRYSFTNTWLILLGVSRLFGTIDSNWSRCLYESDLNY